MLPSFDPALVPYALGAAFTFAGSKPAAVVAAGYLAASSAAFAAYAWDKRAARNGRERVAERTLHLLALIGGWPGALLAQRTLRHKSRKQPFRALCLATILVNSLLLAGLLLFLARLK